MENISKYQSLIQDQSKKFDEIDLSIITSALMRRWPWIAAGGTAGLILSGLYLLTTKPVFQGEFQIVLGNEGSQGAAGLISKNPGLAALASIGGGNSSGADSIATEVQILNSSSVLLPVFEAVRSRKPQSISKNMRFDDWAKSAITAEQVKGTSVVNVKFRDNDKELILPITNLLSKTYQSYSKRGRALELESVIKYLESQIAIFKPLSKESSRTALDYGYEHSLGLLDGLPLAGNISGAGVSKEGITPGAMVGGQGGSLESARTAAQQKVNALEVQLQEARKAGAGSLYFASQLASLTDKSSTFDQLTLVETRLAELLSRLKETDPLVQKLKRERRSLIKYINEQTIALLKGEITLAKANLQSLNRPKNIINRHRDLTQVALRNEATLVNLENQLEQFNLEKARSTRPWELISSPTLLDKPISPLPGSTLAIGFFSGILLGIGSALISDRRSGFVFSCDEIAQFLPYPLLERLPCLGNEGNEGNEHPIDTWKTMTQLLSDGILDNHESVALIPVGSITSADLDTFATCLRKSLPTETKLLISNDLLKTRTCSTQLLVTAQGAAKREQLQHLKEQLALQGNPVAGWILLDTSFKT